MLALVPTIPGTVSAVVEVMPNPLPQGVTVNEYHSCGNSVLAGWYFDGSTFTPTAPSVPPVTPPTLTPAQVASALAETTLLAGLNITSTSTPAINGLYSLTPTSQNNINATITYILLNGTFPGGGSTMAWADASGNPHVFPSIAEFKAFATAVANFVSTVSIYGDTGGAQGSIPANNITIA
jgi:hypothetical protein